MFSRLELLSWCSNIHLPRWVSERVASEELDPNKPKVHKTMQEHWTRTLVLVPRKRLDHQSSYSWPLLACYKTLERHRSPINGWSYFFLENLCMWRPNKSHNWGSSNPPLRGLRRRKGSWVEIPKWWSHGSWGRWVHLNKRPSTKIVESCRILDRRKQWAEHWQSRGRWQEM